MKRVDIYNSDYTELNHAYIQIYDSYMALQKCEDSDKDIQKAFELILTIFNPALDKIKSEMTVRTRFKESNSAKEKKSPAGNINIKEETSSNGGKIIHPDFGGC